MNQENKFRNTRSHSRPKRKGQSSTEKNILPRIIAKCVGLVMPVFVVFLIISFCSYIFSYQNDQSIVEAFLKNFSLEPVGKIKNWGGLCGAILSYFFVFRYFGFISSLIVIFLLFFCGVKLARFKRFARWDSWKVLSLSLLLIFIVNSCIGIFHLENFFNGNFSGFLSSFLGTMLLQSLGFISYVVVLLLILVFLFFAFDSEVKKYFSNQNESDNEKETDIEIENQDGIGNSDSNEEIKG